MRCTQLEPGYHVLLQWKGFQAKHKIADQWENTTYGILEKLKCTHLQNPWIAQVRECTWWVPSIVHQSGTSECYFCWLGPKQKSQRSRGQKWWQRTPLWAGLHTTGWGSQKNESNEDIGVQPLGHGCENVTLHLGLVEIAPILSEQNPQNLVLGGRPRACKTYLKRYLFISYFALCREEFREGGRYAIDHAIRQTCLSLHRGKVKKFSHPKDICDAWWSFSSPTPKLHYQVNCWNVVSGINDKQVASVSPFNYKVVITIYSVPQWVRGDSWLMFVM